MHSKLLKIGPTKNSLPMPSIISTYYLRPTYHNFRMELTNRYNIIKYIYTYI